MDSLKIDYYSFVDYEYDTYTSCEESGCDYICRCSQIVDFTIKSIDVSGIAESIYNQYFDDSKESKRDMMLSDILYNIGYDINLYTIDRVLRYHKVYDIYSWTADIGGGYYGEEIYNIEFNDIVSLKNSLDNALSINDLDKRIEYLLKLEYDYILPELQGVSYKVLEVEHDDIKLYSDFHFKNVSNENISFYEDKNYSGVRGILLETKNGYRLIDGYHRFAASDDVKSKFIVATNI